MGRIEGSFYLKMIKGGNLLGEYTNNDIYSRSWEIANLKEPGDAPFLGRYKSQWLEVEGPYTGELVIERIKDTNNTNKQYRLTWYRKNGEVAYTGEAILADGMLMGHYINYY